MRHDQLVKEKRGEILRVASRYGAHDVRVFGSVARGEAGDESHVDFLVELEAGRSLLDSAPAYSQGGNAGLKTLEYTINE